MTQDGAQRTADRPMNRASRTLGQSCGLSEESSCRTTVHAAGRGSTREQAPWRPTWAVPVPAEEGLLDPQDPATGGHMHPDSLIGYRSTV